MKTLLFILVLLLIAFPTHVVAQLKVPGALIKVSEHVEVPAREAGVLMSLPVREGSVAEEDSLLAQIDDKEARFALQRAEVELQIAKKNAESDIGVLSAEKSLRFAEEEWRRAQETIEKSSKSISKTELNKLELAADQGRLAVDKAKQEQGVAVLTHQLKAVEHDFAKRNVERRQITAPFRGVVVQMYRQRGEWVEPGDKLLRMVRLDKLRVEGFLSAREATEKMEGRTVHLILEPPSGETKYAGKLVFVSPEVDPVNNQVRIVAEIANPNLSLRPGLRGTLMIER